jgi:hypothetical protein
MVEVIQYVGEIVIDFNLNGKIDQRTLKFRRECISLPPGNYFWEAKVSGRSQFGKLNGKFVIEANRLASVLVICADKEMRLSSVCVAAPGNITPASGTPPLLPPQPPPTLMLPTPPATVKP